MTTVRRLAIIGGSNFLNSQYFAAFEILQIDTPFGQVTVRANKNRDVFFVQRHAANPTHEYSPPHLINKRGIIQAFKQLECSHILAFGSTGSLKKTIPIGTLVLIDDYVNFGEQVSFFQHSKQGHLVPQISKEMRSSIHAALSTQNISILQTGTYVQSTGPRFETAAEIRAMAQWGDVIGMTCGHEAALANEAGIEYSVVCMVDNMANGVLDRPLTEEEFHTGVKRNLVTMEKVLGILLQALSPVHRAVEKDDRISVDSIVSARYIVPIEPAVVHEHYALVVDKGVIIALLNKEEAFKNYKTLNHRHFENHVITPGLINCHTHVGMTLLRGYSDDLCLSDWLNKDIWPTEREFVSPDFVEVGSELAMAEMIRGGTTTFNDMYFFPDVITNAVDRVGLRANIGVIFMDFPTVWASSPQEYLDKGFEVMKNYDKHPRIRFTMAPHAPYTVCDENWEKVRDLAADKKMQIHTHVHETRAEVHDSEQGIDTPSRHRSEQNSRPLANLHRLKCVNPNLICVHMTQISQSDLDILQQTHAHVVHCPSSNMKLSSGFCPVTQLIDCNVNVAIGTDSSASNNMLDMWTETRNAALVAKCVSHDPTSVPAYQALRMATINGAKALGVDHETGSLEVGKSADFVALKFDELEMMPLFDVISHLVYAASRSCVTDVWVAGRPLLIGKQLQTIDTANLVQRIKAWNEKLSLFKSKLELQNGPLKVHHPTHKHKHHHSSSNGGEHKEDYDHHEHGEKKRTLSQMETN